MARLSILLFLALSSCAATPVDTGCGVVSKEWEYSMVKAIEVELDYLPCEATVYCETLSGDVESFDVRPQDQDPEERGLPARWKLYGACLLSETPIALEYSACTCDRATAAR